MSQRNATKKSINSNDLKSKEERYRSLNDELESKTAHLLQEADDVLKYAQTSSLQDETPNGKTGSYLASGESFAHSFKELEKTRDVTKPNLTVEDNDPVLEDVEGILPEPANKLSLKAQNRFLQAKLGVLREELQRVNTETNDYHVEVAQLKKRCQELEEDHCRVRRTNNNQTQQFNKTKKELDTAKTRADVLEAERNNLRKETDAAKRTVSQQATELKATSQRLQRASEEVERLKNELASAHSATREGLNNLKQSNEQLTTENRRLERQKTELLSIFKKQLRLIDVLKRQKMLIEASKCLQLTEEEFLKSLDMHTNP